MFRSYDILDCVDRWGWLIEEMDLLLVDGGLDKFLLLRRMCFLGVVVHLYELLVLTVGDYTEFEWDHP